MSHSSPFDDLPLDATEKTFRLFRFKTGSGKEGIDLELAVFDVGNAPKYVALSYAWGSQADKATILVNQSSIDITRSLHEFISTIQSSRPRKVKSCPPRKTFFIEHFRNQDCGDFSPLGYDLNSQWLWADQISMNQHDVLERNHQVGMMGLIFSRAKVIWAWLGPRPAIPDHDLELFEKNYYQNIRQTEVLEVLYSLNIFSRPYWFRLWIVQELCLNPSRLFWCGDASFTTAQLFYAVGVYTKKHSHNTVAVYTEKHSHASSTKTRTHLCALWSVLRQCKEAECTR